jgi:hypothetical protein
MEGLTNRFCASISAGQCGEENVHERANGIQNEAQWQQHVSCTQASQ